jgi:diguanylate cyclase (GGDEF)-like protein
MNKRRIFSTIAIIMMVMFLAMIVNISLNLRDFGFDSAKTKAELVAQSVKNGLTAHMVNGIMDNRKFFIEQTKNLDNVDDLWIVRSKVVISQYGEGTDLPHDAIDKEVLKTGKTVVKVNENFLGHSTYRITIPYKAEKTQAIDCLQCHKVKIGNTLGVISMDLSIDDLKITSTNIILYTSAISFLLILIILWFVGRLINPYFSIFDSIKDVMKKANSGDYSGRITNIKSGEAKDVATWINDHMAKLQSNLQGIEEQIDVFLTAHKYNNDKNKDPIIDVHNTVKRLADIYKFRQVIEHDERIEDVYNRFADVLKDKFGIVDFNFIEADTTNKSTEVVYISQSIICDPVTSGCRSDRTNTLVDSCQFNLVCDKFKDDSKLYLCMPYSISNDLDFILSIISDTVEEHDRVRNLLPLIQDYVDSAKPEIVSKKLMQVLERNAQTDPLTGLFNRKYLEIFIDKVLYNGRFKNMPCGLMMVDIDFFKLINDNYGHDIGDIAIKTIANTLTDVVTEDDVVIRFGGEEFIVIITDCDEERLIKVAEKIRIVFSQQQIHANSETFSKTVSIGVSLFPNTNKEFWKYVKQTDIAMYEAKQTGRNKVVKFTEDLK